MPHPKVAPAEKLKPETGQRPSGLSVLAPQPAAGVMSQDGGRGNGHLLPVAQGDAIAEDVVIAGLDGGEQGRVGPNHRVEDWTPRQMAERNQATGSIKSARARAASKAINSRNRGSMRSVCKCDSSRPKRRRSSRGK